MEFSGSTLAHFTSLPAINIKLNTFLQIFIVLKIMHTLSLLGSPPEKTVIYFDFSTKTYVVGTQKNSLNETVLLSTQNISLN